MFQFRNRLYILRQNFYLQFSETITIKKNPENTGLYQLQTVTSSSQHSLVEN